MSQSLFPGGVDLLPGPQGPPIPSNGLRIVTIGGALFTTIDGLTFTSIAGNVPASTSSTAGLMSAAQFNALAGQQASKLPGALQFSYTDVIDLTTTGTYVIIPAMPFRIITNLLTWEIKTTTSPTVSPTYSVGSNSASFNNRCASQATAALITQATETVTGPSLVNPGPALDITTSGLQLNVTVGATATALTARFFATFYVLPV